MAMYIERIEWHVGEKPPGVFRIMMEAPIQTIVADGDELDWVYRHTNIPNNGEYPRTFNNLEYMVKILEALANLVRS